MKAFILNLILIMGLLYTAHLWMGAEAFTFRSIMYLFCFGFILAIRDYLLYKKIIKPYLYEPKKP